MGRSRKGYRRASCTAPALDAPPPTISREELQAMHGGVKAMSPQPGSEAFSLMCVLAACMDNWPRVRAEKATEVRRRFQDLHRDTRNNNLVRPRAAIERKTLPVIQSPVGRPSTFTASERSSVRPDTTKDESAALRAFLSGLKDLPDDTGVIALPGCGHTGLTLGQLRRLAGTG